MKSLPAIIHAPETHPAILRAAARLREAFAAAPPEGIRQCRVGEPWEVDAVPVPARTFRVACEGDTLVFTGDRPRSVLAGVLYYLHHRERGTLGDLPLERTSPHRDRLILEDFAANTYQPTGFDFDLETYAENLVALGYTSMECNRLSRAEPIHPFVHGYEYTNPSPALFVWTKWHEGVWPRERIESHGRELERLVRTALAFDLDPSITSFVPRPYPETFFARHPHLRGSWFRHEYLRRGDHPALYRVDTDHPDGLAFYRAVYEELIGRHPHIRHLFFWHADLGTRFWTDGEGPRKRREVDRIAEFHAMLEQVLAGAGCAAQVWLNPWAMPEGCLGELDRELSPRVGYAVKDNTGAAHFCGTTRVPLMDLTVFTPTIGELARRMDGLAAASHREVCLGQYQDFSEDLDPILSVPHPLLTFRKFKSLQAYGGRTSSSNWGVISPDASPARPNQDVIREMTWAGDRYATFTELLPALVGDEAGPGIRRGVYEAWLKIDLALQMWPQFWGLRLQDNGLRFRWLIKPFLLHPDDLPEEDKAYYLDAQIYRMDSPDPFDEFTPISRAQGVEIEATYTEMLALLDAADARLASLAREAAAPWDAWIEVQRVPLGWLRFFFTTFRNLFSFHGLPKDGGLTPVHRAIIEDEVRNTRAVLAHLAAHPRSLIVAARGKWGQCFGPDIARDFETKLALLERTLGTASHGEALDAAPEPAEMSH